MSTIDNELQAAIDDARDSFDLGEELNARSFNTEVVTVFTDEKIGKQLGGEYPKYDIIGRPDGVEYNGVLGRAMQIKALRDAGQATDDDLAELSGLMDEAESLLKELESTAWQVEVRSIPDDVKKQAKRKAKEVLGIKGKVSADEQEEFDRKDFAFVVAKSLVSITRADGKKRTRFAVNDAEYLRDKLPQGEWPKIHTAIMELSYKAAIATKHTLGDPDFSPAG